MAKILICVFILSGFLNAASGRVYLLNGNIFDGEIVISSPYVFVYPSSGVLKFSLNRVRKIFLKGGAEIKRAKLLEIYNRKKIEFDTKEYDNLIIEAAKKYKLDPLLLKAIMKVESNFNPLAKSRKGARGLMQLMPATAYKTRTYDVHDPRENIFGGAEYFSKLLKRYDGDLRLALAAYNAGPAAVKKYQGIPPYPETRNYVKQILRIYEIERKPKVSGGK